VEVARPSGWTVAGIAIAAVLAAPLLILPLSFVGQPDAFDQIAASLLPDALRASLVLAVGVGAGTLVLLGQYDEAGPLQRGVRDALGVQLPDVRNTVGTIAVLTLVLYPYVYVLGRSAFLGQSRQALEAARTLGLSHAAAVRRVALPLARPALAGGVALAVMEALADFGAVNLLNYRALTDAIYRVWYGTFDQAAALQLATVLVSLTLGLVALERLLRGRARYHQALAHGDAVVPRRLHGAAAWLATAGPVLLLIVVVVAPLVQLVAWAVRSLGDGASAEALLRAAVNSLLLASIAAVVAVCAATVVAYGPRAHPSRLGAAAARVSALGYAMPGTVVAVAVYVPLSWLDGRIDDLTGAGLLITGTAAGLILAYVVRFNALALFSVQTRMGRIDPALDEAARGLGADRTRLLSEVHLPLLWPGIATAALLVFVEVMKELPATALLRPLGGDTLAIAVWEATKDSRFETAALPALLIVAVGLVPVVLAIRLSHGTPALPAPERTGVDELVRAP
jgi:iron(III) transport system permease protein